MPVYQGAEYEQAKAVLATPARAADEVTVEMVGMLLGRIEDLERHVQDLYRLMANHEHSRLVSGERAMESRET